MKQLEIKDKQIEELNKKLDAAHKLIDQEQQLHAMYQNKIELLEQKESEPPKKRWWHK